MMAGAAAILSIPGVREANAFNDWARARNVKEDTDFFGDPPVTSWVEVPGIQEHLEDYYQNFQADDGGVEPDSDEHLELLLTDRASPHDD